MKQKKELDEYVKKSDLWIILIFILLILGVSYSFIYLWNYMEEDHSLNCEKIQDSNLTNSDYHYECNDLYGYKYSQMMVGLVFLGGVVFLLVYGIALLLLGKDKK